VDKCPACGSDDLAVNEFDNGRESETGYHDAGVTYTCRNCGHTGDM